MVELIANSGDPDQTPRSAAFDLGLHCLPITVLRVHFDLIRCSSSVHFFLLLLLFYLFDMICCYSSASSSNI